MKNFSLWRPIGIVAVLAAVAALLLALLAPAQSAPALTTGCPAHVVNNAFRACYFRGLDPATTDRTRFLGSVQEASLGHPVPGRVYAINHDWGTGPVFDSVAPGNGGSSNDVSGTWRGRLFFPGGHYDVTVWSSGGVRVTVDDDVVLDEWSATDGGRFAAAVSPRHGYHQIVVTWNTPGGRSALLRLHWDRLPDVAHPVVSHIRIETFIVDRQDVCIAGDPWTSGTPMIVRNADGSPAEQWQIEDDRGLPVALPPSDPSLASYAQVACYSFGYTDEEKAAIRRDLAGFANLLS